MISGIPFQIADKWQKNDTYINGRQQWQERSQVAINPKGSSEYVQTDGHFRRNSTSLRNRAHSGPTRRGNMTGKVSTWFLSTEEIPLDGKLRMPELGIQVTLVSLISEIESGSGHLP